MFGVDMMFKSLGIDPDEFKNTVSNAFKKMADLEAQLNRIENTQLFLIKKLAENGAIEIPEAKPAPTLKVVTNAHDNSN